jgi:hypothetical protein
VVVVMPCPSCHELVVLFRNKVIPLSRKIIEHGTREERKMHLADIIDEFLDAGAFLSAGEDSEDAEQESEPATDSPARLLRRRPRDAESASEEASADPPITQEEFDRFLKIDLKCIDNATYFKKHFG